MSKIVVITGSARPNSVNKIVTKEVLRLLGSKTDIKTEVADLAAMNLPFFDATAPPSRPNFTFTHKAVQEWSDQIKSADGVIFTMPEYNHSMTALQKNAIDWLYNEWKAKPTAVVAYGFYGGEHSLTNFQAVNDVIKLDLVEPIARFTLGKEITPDGVITDQEVFDETVGRTIDGLLDKISSH